MNINNAKPASCSAATTGSSGCTMSSNCGPTMMPARISPTTTGIGNLFHTANNGPSNPAATMTATAPMTARYRWPLGGSSCRNLSRAHFEGGTVEFWEENLCVRYQGFWEVGFNHEQIHHPTGYRACWGRSASILCNWPTLAVSRGGGCDPRPCRIDRSCSFRASDRSEPVEHRNPTGRRFRNFECSQLLVAGELRRRRPFRRLARGPHCHSVQRRLGRT
ncbi:unannotated protein [freshwater metagenome]|uniref:Unannotated protein n=1 Tax=freshwater metagenome TaxID=449393 RepID=A0A6J7KTH5_9ZZZZ